MARDRCVPQGSDECGKPRRKIGTAEPFVTRFNSTLIILQNLRPALEGIVMKPHDLTDEQKKLVWRYVEVWRRFRGLSDGDRSFAKLEEDFAQGSGMFLCGLLVQAEASTVITADVKDPKFHVAIFGKDDSAVTDMTADELQRARRYIIHGQGDAPVRWWWGKPPVPALAAGTDPEEVIPIA